MPLRSAGLIPASARIPMHALTWWLAAVASAFACAAVAEPVLRRSGLLGRAVTVGIVALIFCSPFIVPADLVRTRAMTSLVAVMLAFKLIDYRRHCLTECRDRPRYREFLRFLIPYPLVLLFGPHQNQLESPPLRRIELVRCLSGAAVFAGVFYLLTVLSFVPQFQQSFLLDHCLKVFLFVIAIESASLAVVSAERLGGFKTNPLACRIYLSRSVTEFWLRYNTRVHDWLYHNVFRPCGGRKSPVRAVLLTFLVSGLFHEWMFGITTSRFDGYQFAFFMLQAPACLLSPKLQRLARRPALAAKLVAHAVTILWFTATTMLFFHGVDRVFDTAYAAAPWLP